MADTSQEMRLRAHGEECEPPLRASEDLPPFPRDNWSVIPGDACTGTDCREACEGVSDATCDRFLDRIHDIFAWRAFIAVNWPHVAAKEADLSTVRTSCEDMLLKPALPRDRLSETGVPLWCTWPDAAVAFHQDDTEHCSDRASASDYLLSSSTAPPPSSDTVWDQNGNPVDFDVRVPPVSFRYFVCHSYAQYERYHLGAQCGVVNCGRNTDQCTGLKLLSWGRCPDPGEPAEPSSAVLHLKLAWKRLAGGDDRGRFLLRRGGAAAEDEFGLVAMHVTAKTETSQRSWLWATFEHVDSIDPPEPGRKPLFRDPDCTDCEDNKCPPPEQRRTQLRRVTPIPEAVRDLNGEVQRLLAEQGSVLQYYQLIGIQRRQPPRRQPPGKERPSIVACSRSGPEPEPADLRPPLLANAIIEWNQQSTSCFGCHMRAPGRVFKAAGDCEEHGCIPPRFPESLPCDAEDSDVILGPGCADFFFQASRFVDEGDEARRERIKEICRDLQIGAKQ